MTKQELQRVQDCIDNEGFDYTFADYSAFPDVKDAEFHRLREAYLAARTALATYCEVES